MLSAGESACVSKTKNCHTVIRKGPEYAQRSADTLEGATSAEDHKQIMFYKLKRVFLNLNAARNCLLSQ